MSSVSRFCLPPLQENFKTRIAARGRLAMDWKLLTKPTASVVSHRASLFGDDQPDTAYRQAVIRIQSSQALSLKGAATRIPNASKPSIMKGVKWQPAEATTESKTETLMSNQAPKDEGRGTRKEVVEYLVLQKRVIRGKEEDWKVWGFTQESTPEKIEDDAAYWRKTLAAQS
jgi:protein MBA1